METSISPFESVLQSKGYVRNEKGEWCWSGKVQPKAEAPVMQVSKRIRQDKETLNKLETEFHRVLTSLHDPGRIHAQSVRFQLANGLWYKPDFVVFSEHAGTLCYEVKGPHAFRGGFENLKMAAERYRHLTWYLVWKEKGVWQSQLVRPTLTSP